LLSTVVDSGIEKEELFFFSKGSSMFDAFLPEDGSVDDFGSWRGVMPVTQELEFGSSGGEGCVDDEIANGRGNVDWRE